MMIGQRIAAVAVAAAVLTGFAVAASATAGADSVSQFQTGASGPYGYGAVNISTEPGGYISVSVSGRTNAINSGMPGDGVCFVQVDDRQADLKLDQTGSGAVRFGPLSNGTYTVQGTCADRGFGRINMVNPSSVSVSIDGNGPTSYGSRGPTPPAVETLSQYCDRMIDTANGVGTMVALAGLAYPPAAAVGLPVSAAVMSAAVSIRGTCLYYATQIGDSATVAQQFCRSIEDAIKAPLDALPVRVPIAPLLPSFC